MGLRKYCRGPAWGYERGYVYSLCRHTANTENWAGGGIGFRVVRTFRVYTLRGSEWSRSKERASKTSNLYVGGYRNRMRSRGFRVVRGGSEMEKEEA